MQELIESVGQLSAKQRKALAVLLKQKGVNLFDIAPVFKRTAEEPLLLSYAQQRQWFLWQWAPHSAAYNVPTALRLQGPLDVTALERSVQALIERHETLRTVFTQETGQPLQVVLPAGPFALEIHQLSAALANDPEASIQAFVQTQSQKTFDLEHGPLLRAALLQVTPHDHVLVLTLHHIVSDGWSLQVMIEELVQLYAGFNLGHDAGLPALPIQYADYALWQRQWMEAGEQERQLAYWQEKLGGEQPVLELPMDRPRSIEQSFAGASHNLILDPTLSNALKAFARKENVTLFVLLLASFQALLHRYSGQPDIRVGVPVANRGRVEIERLIGFFVNTQVLKADIDGQLPFVDLLRQVKQTAQQAQAHQDLPFEQLVEALEPGRSLSHSPLFQVMFNHQAERRASVETRLNGLSIEPLEWQSQTAQFDLTLNTTEQAHGIEAVLKYATDLFDAATIERLAQHWTALLQAIVAEPTQRIGQLPMLDGSQQQQLLAQWNPALVEQTVEQCIHQTIEAQAKRHPDAVAVTCDGQRLTYAELNRRANQWAHVLIERGVGPDVRVGVAVERSLDMIVAILAVLKAGGAYVPLDPGYPDDRLSHMIEDSGIELLLTQEHLLAQLPVPQGLACLDLNQTPEPGNDTNPVCLTTPDNLAYVIYTSGSTGKPKGALLPHSNVMRLFSATEHWFDFGPQDSWTLFHSYAFDFSVWEIFGALLYGGKLVVVPHDVSRSPEDFYTLLCDENVTVLNQTPSAFKPLMQVASESTRDNALRYVVFGGESLEVQSLRPWFERFGDCAPTLVNMYGITETTVHVTYRPLSLADLQHSHSSPIGEPIVDLSWYLLDNSLNLVPQGCIGELYIAGAGLARGYLNQAGMTATRFVPDPFNPQAGERLYRTGDLARLRGDGVIEYIGRIDHQVKIRGFRIELGEIEAQLLKHPEVREAVVLAVDGLSGQQLATWIVANETLDAEGQGALRESIKVHLRQSLPDYMVPVSWAFLERLPLTANGKLDRKQLPQPDVAQVQEAYASPRNELEQRLAEIWQDVLKIERVGLNDNFFELGGDSIISIQVVSRARQAGIRFTPKDIFQHQTVQRLATVAQQSDAVQTQQGEVLGDAVLTPIQHYFFNSDIPARHHWNQSILLTPATALQAAPLAQALQHLQRHHDALRLRYRQSSDGWQQSHAPAEQAQALLRTFTLDDRAALPALCLDLQRSLDLLDGPLIRAALVDLPDASQRLLLVIHHLVVDGVSWRILLEDLQTAYQQLSTEQAVRLPAKTSAFKEWGKRLQEHARSAELESELDYWRGQLRDVSVELPLDNPQGQLSNRFERSVDTRLDAERTRQLLQQAPAVYRTQVNDLLLTALARVLCQWTHTDSALVQLEGHGREDLFDDVDLSRTVGWFTSMFPVRLSPEVNLEASIKGIKEQLRAIPNKGIGYGLLRHLGSPEAQASLNPLAQPKVTFNYLGQFDNNFDVDALWVPATEDKGAGQDENAPMANWLTIDGRVYQGQLSLTWTYSSDVFEEATINALARAYEVALGELIDHCLSHPSGGLTPSDVPLAGLSQAHLDSLPIAAQRIEDIYPLAPMQQGILFHSLYDADASAYVYQMLLDIDGLDVARFQQAWQRVVDRHEVLRAGFIWGRDGLDAPLQVINRQLTLEMPEVDVRGVTDLPAVLEARAQADRERGFDLQNPPLLRLCLLRTADDRHRLIFTCHHILMDGWSNSRMFGEVLQDYAGHPVPSAQGRYRDFLVWLQGQDKAGAEDFWRGQLAELDEPTRLASACHGRTVPGPGKQMHRLHFDEVFTQRLNSFSRQQQVTLNSLVQAAWLLVLQRYTGQATVAFGATVSGRPVDLPGIEQQLGLFINTLPVIASPQATVSVGDWVRSVQDKNLLLRDFEQTPLQDIQRLAQLSGEALFDTLLVFENYPVSEALEANPGGLRFAGLEHREQTNYGLTLIAGASDVLNLDFNYLTEHFAERSVQGLAAHMQEVLRQFLEAPQRLLGEIGLLSVAERQTLAQWNDNHATYPAERLIPQSFEARVQMHPHAQALSHAGVALSYAELNQRANQLARHLQVLGVGPEIRVGVAMPRSAELVIALMAVLKAGGTYVPLDPDYPADRVAYMLEDSQAKVLLTQQSLLAQLPQTDAEVVLVEAGDQAFAELSSDNLPAQGDSANLAYVIYTSGSTGKPKGVAIAHRNVQALIHWSAEVYSEDDLQGVLASTSVCFDLSVWEIFVTLARGGSIVMARNALELPDLPERDQVRLINTVPSAIAALQRIGQIPQGVRIINLAGEPLKQSLVDTLYRETAVAHVYDLYGPSEDTTYSTCTRREFGGQANIGRPLVNTMAYMLDGQLQPAPIGVAAELYLAGDGITRGYLFRPGLTAERFVPNPLSRTGERMYRTGDLTRFTDDGRIEYVGRIDHQVKVRGFRIELGEIEARLLARNSVRDGVVLAVDGPSGQQLVAYVVPSDSSLSLEEQDALSQALQDVLKAHLPEYMVPAQWLFLEQLPLTPNGKLDRKALPAPDASQSQRDYVAPSTPLEQQLAEVWQDILKIERVGVTDNFFALGGDSIISIQLVSRARQQGIRFTPKDLFQQQTVQKLATVVSVDHADSLSDTPADYPLAQLDQAQLDALPMPADMIEDVYPLSPMQEGMLFHTLSDNGSSLYMQQVSLPIKGLDVERFRKAWEFVIVRQAILRTSFHWQDGLAKPLQVVHRHAPLQMQVLDWRERDFSEAAIAEFASDDRALGFDLADARLQRITLLRLSDDQYQMIWTSHHILMDGWSSSRLFGEVLQYYAKGEIIGENGRYRDFIAWLQAQDQDAQELFWKARLAAVNEPTALSQAMHPRHSVDVAGHDAIYSNWDKAQTAGLLQFCRDLRITPNTLIQGAWLLLLQRYTGQQTVTFGATVSGRPENLANVGNMLGLFINTLPIIQTPQADQRLADWLGEVQAYNLDIRDYSQAPLADVQRWSNLGGQALFDSIVVFENFPIDDRLQEENDTDLTFGKSIGHGVTNVPMDLAVMLGDELSIEYLYLRSHFSAEAVVGIRKTMENTIAAMLAAPYERLGNLQRLSNEQWQAAQAWSAEPAHSHQTALLPELISRHAQQQPQAIALQCAGMSLSYGELEQRANRLANCLIEHGAGPEVVIGVALPRSLEMVVSFLAVLKSGAAYVPLDIEYPPERLAYMIEDSGMALLLTQSSLRATLPAPEGLLRLEIDDLDESRYADHVPDCRVHEQGLAYLVYTSGSTGRPKGVAVTQGPLSMHCQAIGELYEMDASSCELHFMSFAFDGAHERWLSTLYSGGRLVIRDGCLWTPEQTYQALHDYGITIACFPPAYLKQLAEYAAASGIAPPPVRIYCFGGDAVPDQTFEQVKAALRPEYFTNGYGPTETVVTPMLWKVPVSQHCEAAYAPIGRAVGARSLYVLDEDLNPLPPGFAGELYIGGYGVARGYHGRADLTCERFVPNPFAAGERLYRSGDLVRLRTDGVVDYVGRIDHQVKVRGFRIELGEVEASLRQLTSVTDALVIARDNVSGKQLIGYVVTATGEDIGDELKAGLRASLPEYMVPAQIVCLDAFPVTPNGKLDRKALPEPEFKTEEYIAPRNEQESLLADIWAQVLQVEQVGISDNFFELGGDSILSLQVISRVRNHPTLQMDLKLRDLMRYQTIAGIVEQEVAKEGTAQPQTDVTQVATEGLFNLLPIQEWFFAEGMAEAHHYNQSLLLSARQPLDLDALEQALSWVEQHHDSLRLRFSHEGGRWLQRYCDLSEQGEVLLWCREADNSEQVEALANLAQRSLKLDDGPVWRVMHVALPDGQARLLVVIHHLVVDTVSWRILLDDLKVAYEACVQGQEPKLPIRTSSYRSFAEALQTQAPVIAEQELSYWLEQLDQPGVDLPCDNPRGKNLVRQQAQARLKLSREHTEQLLKQAPAVYGTQINDLLLSALSRALCRWSQQPSALILLEGHGREDLFETIDLSRSLGWFTSMFPVRLRPDSDDIGRSIVNVQAQLAAVPQKGIGYGVLRHLAGAEVSRQLAELPQARVTFNYLGQFDQSFDEQALLVPALEETGDNYSLKANLGNWLEIVGQVYDGQLAMRCIYSSQRYRAGTMDALMNDFQRELEALIEHCMARVG
ncbi:non-ribosomal peptide synthase/polyketide synthase [Pseudomonas jessenii]|uniref:Non-ribosomal peptide synthase protein (TIGR01720 family)/amino acid adenylation domain-containing protein n=1 Tax=Pseudomonas jessenii TaxID=77298 RepID=A0A370SA42_PSEJE|nr:non-ribosomal peptide synthase/polyketide synthase [Pseudomonas jessenii]RDL16574.1 non-ribosomal peptide synthase protein (TIGR01720 family)/amino acid adenylation domain-containing protein [Pseudomonas jessenii]